MTAADGTYRDTFAPGDTITHAGSGYPWTKNVDGTWWRVGQPDPLTWEQVLAWHQAAADNPDDETTEPFRPVLMVPADGTPRVGDTIRTAAGLDALPVGSVVLPLTYRSPFVLGGRVAFQRHTTTAGASAWGRFGKRGPAVPEQIVPATVLFRPDAPQPATTDESADALLRDAWRAEALRYERERDEARAALAAAGAGAEVDREALRIAVGGVLFNAMNYPEPVQARILGQDTGPLTEKVVDAVLAARGDAAPTVTAEQMLDAWSEAVADGVRGTTPRRFLAALGIEVTP